MAPGLPGALAEAPLSPPHCNGGPGWKGAGDGPGGKGTKGPGWKGGGPLSTGG